MVTKLGKRGRKPVPSPKVFNVTVRLSAEEYETVKRAADGYPASTWARVELLRLADAVLASRKEGGRA